MELYKGRSLTRTAEVKEHTIFADTWRVLKKGYNVYQKKWKVISNTSYKDLKEANQAAAYWIKEGHRHDGILKSHGKDPLTYTS